MTLLLDTHIWLWWMTDDPKLPQGASAIIGAAENLVLVSAISVWEIVLKSQVGKLDVEGDLVSESEGRGINLLPFTAAHAQAVGRLPLHHKDPFDRALLAQASNDRLTLLTRDSRLAPYANHMDLLLF